MNTQQPFRPDGSGRYCVRNNSKITTPDVRLIDDAPVKSLPEDDLDPVCEAEFADWDDA